MPDRRNDELLSLLRTRLKQAESEHRRVQSMIDSIVRDAPSGLPFPDGQHRCILAAQHAESAFAEYKQAFAEFWNYVNRGVTPDKGETPK